MRLRYYAPGDEAETAFLLSQFAAIDEFWKQFRQLATKPESGRTESSWLPDLRGVLGEISPELGLEVRRDEAGTRTLYVLPLGRGPCVTLARAVVERASPVLLWNFSVFRPAVSLERALEIVRQDFGIDLAQARARVGVGRGHAIELVIGSHLFGGTEDRDALDAADRLVNSLVGDELYDTWVASVRVMHIARPGPLRIVGQEDSSLQLKLSEVLAAVVAAQRGVGAGLPEAPHHTFCESGDWVMFELGDVRPGALAKDTAASGTPAEASDAVEGKSTDLACEDPVLHQEDLQLATTMCPEMLRCFLLGTAFASSRFSRNAELFCYLKLTLTGSADERVAQRIALEEALDRALVPGGLGCVVGSGVGERYMYINLCLHNQEPALRVTIRKLRQANVQRESWVLFCDTELTDEWIGVFEDSPAPGWLSTHSSTFLDAFN